MVLFAHFKAEQGFNLEETLRKVFRDFSLGGKRSGQFSSGAVITVSNEDGHTQETVLDSGTYLDLRVVASEDKPALVTLLLETDVDKMEYEHYDFFKEIVGDYIKAGLIPISDLEVRDGEWEEAAKYFGQNQSREFDELSGIHRAITSSGADEETAIQLRGEAILRTAVDFQKVKQIKDLRDILNQSFYQYLLLAKLEPLFKYEEFAKESRGLLNRNMVRDPFRHFDAAAIPTYETSLRQATGIEVPAEVILNMFDQAAEDRRQAKKLKGDQKVEAQLKDIIEAVYELQASPANTRVFFDYVCRVMELPSSKRNIYSQIDWVHVGALLVKQELRKNVPLSEIILGNIIDNPKKGLHWLLYDKLAYLADQCGSARLKPLNPAILNILIGAGYSPMGMFRTLSEMQEIPVAQRNSSGLNRILGIAFDYGTFRSYLEPPSIGQEKTPVHIQKAQELMSNISRLGFNTQLLLANQSTYDINTRSNGDAVSWITTLNDILADIRGEKYNALFDLLKPVSMPPKAPGAAPILGDETKDALYRGQAIGKVLMSIDETLLESDEGRKQLELEIHNSRIQHFQETGGIGNLVTDEDARVARAAKDIGKPINVGKVVKERISRYSAETLGIEKAFDLVEELKAYCTIVENLRWAQNKSKLDVPIVELATKLELLETQLRFNGALVGGSVYTRAWHRAVVQDFHSSSFMMCCASLGGEKQGITFKSIYNPSGLYLEHFIQGLDSPMGFSILKLGRSEGKNAVLAISPYEANHALMAALGEKGTFRYVLDTLVKSAHQVNAEYLMIDDIDLRVRDENGMPVKHKDGRIIYNGDEGYDKAEHILVRYQGGRGNAPRKFKTELLEKLLTNKANTSMTHGDFVFEQIEGDNELVQEQFGAGEQYWSIQTAKPRFDSSIRYTGVNSPHDELDEGIEKAVFDMGVGPLSGVRTAYKIDVKKYIEERKREGIDLTRVVDTRFGNK